MSNASHQSLKRASAVRRPSYLVTARQADRKLELWPALHTLRGMKFARSDSFGGKVAVKPCAISWKFRAVDGVHEHGHVKHCPAETGSQAWFQSGMVAWSPTLVVLADKLESTRNGFTRHDPTPALPNARVRSSTAGCADHESAPLR